MVGLIEAARRVPGGEGFLMASAVRELSVETAEFERAMHQYLQLTSKSAEEALNGKARDLMFMAGAMMPKANKALILSSIRNPEALAATRIRNRGQEITKQSFQRSLRAVRNPAIAYMKSAFIRAAKLFPKNAASALTPPPMSAAKHRGTTAQNSLATEHHLYSEAIAKWRGYDIASDIPGKQKLADTAIAGALAWVRIDIENYIKNKLYGHAHTVSAKRAA